MLNESNYFSIENNKKYMGSTQFKGFMSECESGTLAQIEGRYVRKSTPDMLKGSYVHNHFSNTLDLFKAQNPEIYKADKCSLLKKFEDLGMLVQRIERDSFFMHHLSGEKEVIQTGEIEGVPFKIKIDSLHKDFVCDIKIMADFKYMWKDGLKIHFIEFYGYNYQAAIYQEISRQNNNGVRLSFVIAAATKEKEPNLELFEIPQQQLDFCLDVVKQNAPIYANIKLGLIEPTRCGSCDYCKSTKKLTKIIDYTEVGEL